MSDERDALNNDVNSKLIKLLQKAFRKSKVFEYKLYSELSTLGGLEITFVAHSKRTNNNLYVRSYFSDYQLCNFGFMRVDVLYDHIIYTLKRQFKNELNKYKNRKLMYGTK